MSLAGMRGLRRVVSAGLMLALGLTCGGACSRSDSIEDLVALQAEGRFEETVEPLRARVDAEPTDPLLNRLYGEALLRGGDPSGAVWALRRAADNPDLAVEAGLLLATALFQSGNAPDAVQAAGRVLERNPDDQQALMLRALALTHSMRFSEALADFDRLLEADPDNLDARAQRIVPLIRLKRIAEAQASMEELVEAVGESEEKGLRAQLCAARATFEHEQARDETAADLWRTCLAEHEGDTTVLAGATDFFLEIEKPESAIALLRSALEAGPEKSGLRVSLATQLRALGDPEQAEQILLEGTRLHPGAPTYFALADHYRAMEDFGSARSALERGLGRLRGGPPESVRVTYTEVLILAGDLDIAQQQIDAVRTPVYRHLLNGRMLLARGDPAAALEAFEAGSRLWPNNAGARALAGQCATQIGDFDRAISEYKEAVREDPVATSASFALARLLMAEGVPADAWDLLVRYLQERPWDPEALRLAARAAALDGRESDARRVLQRLGRIPGQRAAAVAETVELLWKGRGVESIEQFVSKNDIDVSLPENFATLRVLTEALLEADRGGVAIKRLDAAIAAHPESADLHALRGAVLLAAAGHDEEAGAAFSRALALTPNHYYALMGSGKLAARRGEYRAAVRLFDRAAGADSRASEPGLEAARLLAAEGDPDAAIERLEVQLRLHPLDARAALELARLWLAFGTRLDEARALALRAARFQAGAEAEILRARIELARGEPDTSQRILRGFLRNRPDDPSARFWLGHLLAVSGDGEGARRELERALAGVPFPEADQARHELAGLESRRKNGT